jgi:hypothetical protein
MDQKLASHDKTIEAHRKGLVSLYTAIENLMPMPTLTDRQIGFKSKGTGKATEKP